MSLRVECRRLRLTDGEARSYRIPMAVTKLTLHPEGSTYPLCPRCSQCLDREYLRFCSCCGQKLSWAKLGSAVLCP